MRGTQLLHDPGQSIWIDNITRDMVQSGTLKHYIDEFSVTGLTSNPTIFDHAIKNSSLYDDSIRDELAQGKSGETLFFDLALADVTRASDLLRPIHESTNAVDGWASRPHHCPDIINQRRGLQGGCRAFRAVRRYVCSLPVRAARWSLHRGRNLLS